MNTILVCDDEKDIVNALKIYLSNPDYALFEAYNGQQALNILSAEHIDLVLLDVMMPVMDGIETLARIREEYNMPVILLTAKSEDADKILGLNIGADDYITKPFNVLEVKARVKAIMRRMDYKSNTGPLPVINMPAEEKLEYRDLRLDAAGRRAFVGDREVNLTAREFELLELFVRHPNQVYTREKLLELVWGTEYPGDGRTVDVHVRRLREKIEKNPGEPDYVRTKWGVGYYLA